VSEFYQFQNQDVVTKHIFVGNTRIVSKLSKYNNTSSLHKTEYEGNNIYTYHPDHIGSSNLITDMAGNKFEHIEYTPYGKTWIDEGSTLNIIGYRFTGKELDTETGLYYYGARYLDPQSSRWMSADSALTQYMPGNQGNNNLPGMGGVFNPVNINLYNYATNNPLKYVDPDGNKPVMSNGPLGMIAHKVIQYDFLTWGPVGKKDAEMSHSLGRADLVCEHPQFVEVGEIKPDSYFSNPENNAIGLAQLKREIKGIEIELEKSSTALESYKPNKTLGIPGLSGWKINVFTNDRDPGMVYYSLDDGLEDGTPQPTWAESWGYFSKYKGAVYSAFVQDGFGGLFNDGSIPSKSVIPPFVVPPVIVVP